MKKISIVLIVLMLTLSGCMSVTEIDEDKVKDMSDLITETIINSVGKADAERRESHKIDAKNINKLNIESSVGDIFINKHNSSEATVDIYITAKSKTKEKAQQLVESFNYTLNENWNTLNINTKQEGSSVLEIDNLQTELTINIPQNIDNFVISLNVGEIIINNIDGNYEINNNVGGIEINNSTGTFNLKADVGEIVLENCIPSNKTNLYTNTGDIKAIFADITKAKTITAETGVGDIDMSTPDNSSYEAEINEFMKDKTVISKGDKDTKIQLTTNVGGINFK